MSAPLSGYAAVSDQTRSEADELTPILRRAAYQDLVVRQDEVRL
jgi:hypothetical protein